MITQREVYDAVIIGAGTSGLACAIESKKQNLKCLVIDKGCRVNSIFHFPTNVTLFSTPDLLEIGGIPFVISTEQPLLTKLGLELRTTAHRFPIPTLLKPTSRHSYRRRNYGRGR